MEYTYLAYSNDLYKIGKSKNPVKRIESMLTANPSIVLIAYGVGISEEDLHYEFKNKRFKREWFKLNIHDKKKAIKLLKNQFDGYLSSEITIDFGKYDQTPLKMMKTESQLRYLRWYVKNGNNKWWVNKFKNHLKRKR